MKRSLTKRLISCLTSGLLTVIYALPNTTCSGALTNTFATGAIADTQSLPLNQEPVLNSNEDTAISTYDISCMLDVLIQDDDNAFLAGSVLGLYPVTDGILGTEPELTLTSAGSGQDILYAKSGRYVLKEISAPDGYAASDNEYCFEIVEGNMGTYIDPSDNEIVLIIVKLLSLTFIKTTLFLMSLKL